MPNSARRKAASPTSASRAAPTIFMAASTTPSSVPVSGPTIFSSIRPSTQPGTASAPGLHVRYRWGGSFSGPVRIPKVYNGKNKTFFLFGYEGIHDSRPRHDDTTNTVPTPAMHKGDFSALLSAPNGGASYTIYDPATRAGPNRRRPLSVQTAFPGNKIPVRPVRQGRHRHPRLLPGHRKDPERRHRPAATIRTPPPPKKPSTAMDTWQASTRTSATGSASSSATAPTSGTAPIINYFRQRVRRRPSSASTPKRRRSITFSRFRPPWCLNTATATTASSAAAISPPQRSASISASLGFSPQFVSQVPKGPGALPAHQPDRLHQ